MVIFTSAVKTNNNLHIMRELFEDVDRALREGLYNHVGSSSLWSKHQQALIKMRNKLNDVQVKEVCQACSFYVFILFLDRIKTKSVTVILYEFFKTIARELQ